MATIKTANQDFRSCCPNCFKPVLKGQRFTFQSFERCTGRKVNTGRKITNTGWAAYHFDAQDCQPEN